MINGDIVETSQLRMDRLWDLVLKNRKQNKHTQNETYTKQKNKNLTGTTGPLVLAKSVLNQAQPTVRSQIFTLGEGYAGDKRIP